MGKEGKEASISFKTHQMLLTQDRAQMSCSAVPWALNVQWQNKNPEKLKFLKFIESIKKEEADQIQQCARRGFTS